MFHWLKRRAAGSQVLGLEVGDDGVALAVMDLADRQRPRVTATLWQALEPAADRAAVIKRAVRQLGVQGLPVVAVLPATAYSLVQIEAPDLADDELAAAMRWRVKDLVDFPVDEAVVDVFRLPASRRPGAPALVYVVVAREQVVEGLGRTLTEAGLEVAAVDIVEMAIRNLALHLDHPGRPRAYLQMRPGQTLIEIADGPQVYLSRRVLQEFDRDADAVVLQAQMENLALEVQRSLDYFESQYALGPADQLSVLVCDPRLFEAFMAAAGSFLTVRTERFDLSALDTARGVEPDALGRGVTALGAAMRGLPWAA